MLVYALDASKVPPEWKSPYSYAKELLLSVYEELNQRGLAAGEIQKQLRSFIKDNADIVGELERYRFVDGDGPYTGSESVHNPHPGGYVYDILHPATGKPMRMPANGYRFPYETMKREYIDKGRLIYGRDENRIVKIKLYLRDYVDSLRSVLVLDSRLGAYKLNALFGKNVKVFDTAKPVELLSRLFSFAMKDPGIVLDFVAGSGTTAHAVIDLRRRDGLRRNFILVEVANYFDSVLLPRILKVMFSPEWQDGVPARAPKGEEVGRTPRVVKVLRLESYEDALHNLVTERTLQRERARAQAHKDRLGADIYRLQYLARLPLEASASMLDLAALEHPFDYAIEVLTEDGPRTQVVDLVETFNLLYALHVERLETWTNEEDGGRRYRVVKGRHRGSRRVLVAWRDMADLKPDVERRFLETRLADEEYAEKLINGDCAVPGFRSLDGEFKRLLEEGER